jgi:type IV secretion system protein VirB4
MVGDALVPRNRTDTSNSMKLLPKDKKQKISAHLHEVPMPEYIPYACHYDGKTLLTKNGELMQVIKITGFSSETIGKIKITLREAVRRSIDEGIPSSDIALWLHTLRKRTSLSPGGEYAHNFASMLHVAWEGRHQWEHKFVNTLYLSVIHDGQSLKLGKPADFLKSLYAGALKRSHDAYLKEAFQKLDGIVSQMLRSLESFGAERLTLYQQDGVAYSELLDFLGRIVNLEEVPVDMPMMDISAHLPSSSVAFGNNAFEVVRKGKKSFGAMLTLKEYQELSTDALDMFLQLPQRFIVTQSMRFIPRSKALKAYEGQKEVWEMSREEELLVQSGFDSLFDPSRNRVTDFTEQQLSVMCIADSVRQLEDDVASAMQALARMGVAVIREDLRLEECYWAQLPANFNFLSRQTYLDTERVAGFASLHNFPAGRRSKNHWGNAVTVFHTKAGTPYFFNFHQGDNGHTMVIGPYGAGKTVLVNFLVSEATKYRPKLFYFDPEHASTVFLRALGSYTHTIAPPKNGQEKEFFLNPLSLADSGENRRFLQQWFGYLLTAHGLALQESDEGHIDAVLSKLFTLPKEQRTLLNAAKMFQALGAVHLVRELHWWFGGGKYAYLFDNQVDLFEEKGRTVYGFGMVDVLKEPVSLVPVLSYLFYQVEKQLEGEPAIIVLDEAWKLVDNPVFAPDLQDWLERLKSKNTVVILATESVEDASKSQITESIMQSTATQIFLPNPHATGVYGEVFGLNEREFELLRSMNLHYREFLLKQGADVIVANLDLAGMEELDVLSGNDVTVEAMNKALADAQSNDPDVWIPRFYDLIAQVKREQKLKKQRESMQEMA